MVTKIRDGKVINGVHIPVDQESGAILCQLYVWDGVSDWTPYVPSAGGGGGVDPVGIKDGTTPTQKLAVASDGSIKAVILGSVEVVNDVGNPLPVSGNFYQVTQPVSGPLTDTQLRATAVPVSGPLTDTQLRAVAVPVSGTFWQTTQPVSLAGTVTTKETKPTTGTPSNVAASVTTVTLLASNPNRLGATVYNDDTASVLSLKLGATASATSFTLKIAAGGYYEVPFGYTGIIDGIWNIASGTARVTELT